MTPTRVLPLAGGCNFRDCGGYETRHGTRVRWGRLYRSGVMSGLAPAAALQVAALELRAVCDLRRNSERALHPNPDFGERVRRFEWDTATESSPIRSRTFGDDAAPAAAAAHAAMIRMYEQLPFQLQPRLAGVFTALEHANPGATIVHCMAGKDRTGVAVALVLEALGVGRDTIIEDYVMTNSAVDLRAHIVGRRATGAGLVAPADPMLAMPPAALDAILAARPEYLLASLAAIEARSGSLAGYLQDELAVSARALERLRESLTE
jgi:protein-tyrosine phosphatase